MDRTWMENCVLICGTVLTCAWWDEKDHVKIREEW
jgi:hypothetical protein